MKIVNTRNFEKDSHLKELNIHVNTKEMLEIKGSVPSLYILINIFVIYVARVLAPPEIKYRNRQGQGDTIERVNCGKWRIGNWFHTTPEITRWGLIYFGDKPDNRTIETVNILADQLPQVGSFSNIWIFLIDLFSVTST
jgi:hypothetical protein